MGWRNASLRPLDEQFGWDTSVRGTGVVREDPLQAALWAPRPSAAAQRQEQPHQRHTPEREPTQAAAGSQAGSLDQPQHAASLRQPAGQPGRVRSEKHPSADGEGAATPSSAPAAEQPAQGGSDSEQADVHTLLMLSRLRVRPAGPAAAMPGLSWELCRRLAAWAAGPA